MASEDEVTLLFEQHSITQVQELLNKTRADIECKKEDLRVMVGERYRDLIEAADTIAEMQNSAKAICNNIKTMEGLCESLQQRGLIGFKTQSTHANGVERKTTSGSHYSLAVQVKLLVGVPEALWGLTEHGQYLPASQLLLLAHHTHTALQLSPTAAQVYSWFPVIERQWMSITQFQSTIVRGCSSLISSEVEDTQAVLDAVVSVMLVERCGWAEALSRVLGLRRKALMAAITSTPSATAKTQIAKFTKLFLATLNIVYAIFVSEGGEETSLLERRLQEVVQGEGESAAPVSLLQESSLNLSFLPQSIRNFRPSIQGSTKSLGNEYIKEEVSKWLDTVLGEASHTLASLLSFTTSVKALAMIRSSVWEIFQNSLDGSNWMKVTQVLYGGPLDPWDSVVRSQVTERARQVVSSQLAAAKEATLQMVAKLATDITAEPKICSEEGDISSYVWSESSSDLPEQVGWTSAAARSVAQAGGLYHKTRGFTARIQNICQTLNAQLTNLLQDVGHFSYDPTKADFITSLGNNSVENEKRTMEDYISLLNYLQDASCSSFMQLVNELEELAQKHLTIGSASAACEGWEEEAPSAAPTSACTVVVVVGRTCQALPSMCSHLQICASASNISAGMVKRISMGSKQETESWIKVRTALQEAGNHLFGLFLKSLTSALHTELKTSLSSQISADVAASISAFSTWEVVDIEEEGEGGKVIRSAIHVPAHPMPALSQALAHVCSSANCIAVHTVSRNAQSELVASTCEAVIVVYEGFLKESEMINQTSALQLIFDLRFVQTLLLPRDSKNLGTRLTFMIQELQQKVDPFDLDVFSPHLSARVKLAAQRSQVFLGAVVPRDRQVIASRSSASATSSVSHNNALPVVVAVEIPRFSNVPLPVSASRPSIPSSASAPSLMLPTTSADQPAGKQGFSKLPVTLEAPK
ncbi:conserved oligomeric Golgi complex subunit 1-like isoform X2 [Portunus trituberculatus]|uniref:conserved oligomeric Golgi complex subunit 1-like isoform X2 n=1 Tax=Portunus trituberculatus TaxID=210409 RepID=UPI001E1D04A6|nr:conserved oligomeric Golgi complex subunit 1-like isoform X2 [Portunus trituberculatus]